MSDPYVAPATTQLAKRQGIAAAEPSDQNFGASGRNRGRWPARVTYCVALAGLILWLSIQVRVAVAQGFSLADISWSDDALLVAIFIVWTLAPYAGLAGLAYWLRRGMVAAILVAVGALVVAGWGLSLQYYDLRHYMIARQPGEPEVLNCGGPIVQLLTPMFQWTGIVVVGAVAKLSQLIEQLWRDEI